MGRDDSGKGVFVTARPRGPRLRRLTEASERAADAVRSTQPPPMQREKAPGSSAK